MTQEHTDGRRRKTHLVNVDKTKGRQKRDKKKRIQKERTRRGEAQVR